MKIKKHSMRSLLKCQYKVRALQWRHYQPVQWTQKANLALRYREVLNLKLLIIEDDQSKWKSRSANRFLRTWLIGCTFLRDSNIECCEAFRSNMKRSHVIGLNWEEVKDQRNNAFAERLIFIKTQHGSFAFPTLGLRKVDLEFLDWEQTKSWMIDHLRLVLIFIWVDIMISDFLKCNEIENENYLDYAASN